MLSTLDTVYIHKLSTEGGRTIILREWAATYLLKKKKRQFFTSSICIPLLEIRPNPEG